MSIQRADSQISRNNAPPVREQYNRHYVQIDPSAKKPEPTRAERTMERLLSAARGGYKMKGIGYDDFSFKM